MEHDESGDGCDAYAVHYRQTSPAYDRFRLDDDGDVDATLAVMDSLHSLSGARYLDIGCGTARYSRRAQGYSVELSIGVDRSIDQVRSGGFERVAVCDAARLPLADDGFDVCSLIMMLQQNDALTVGKIVGEAIRVVRPAGLVFIKTRSEADINEALYPELFPSSAVVNLARYPSVESLKAQLVGRGIVDIIETPLRRFREMSATEYLESVRARHNTTLSLIPPQEYESGVQKLELVLAGVERVQVPLFHTIVSGRKGHSSHPR